MLSNRPQVIAGLVLVGCLFIGATAVIYLGKHQLLNIAPSGAGDAFAATSVAWEASISHTSALFANTSSSYTSLCDADMEGPWCPDIAPTDDYSCAEQAEFGKCDEAFMEGYCWYSCDRCPECSDLSPGPEYNCAEQAEFDKCGADFMMEKGFQYCQFTCGLCPDGTDAETATPVIDVGEDSQTEVAQLGPNFAGASAKGGDTRDTDTMITRSPGSVSVSSKSTVSGRRL